MSDFKSKIPDFNELTHMTGKLFKDVKNSVCEIIDDYKKKRAEREAEEAKKASETPTPPPPKTSTVEDKPAPKKTESAAEDKPEK